MSYRFNRMEVAGSLGDLGVLLPLALGMIMINRLDPSGLFFGIGLFYCCSGLYFRIPVAVQPMKAIGSYAIALEMTADQVLAAGLSVGVILLFIGLTGLVGLFSRLTPKPVIRGVQLSTGLLLIVEGVKLALGRSGFQLRHGSAEPFLRFQDLAGIPVQYLLGGTAFILVLLLLNSKRYPASTVLMGTGLLVGLVLGDALQSISLGIHLPELLPAGFPPVASFSTALVVLVLPQLPMTIGNAVLANVDLAQRYFHEKARFSTGRALCISMGLANIGSFMLGGMPMCHGAGGLAAHYRFGARTGGSNLIIGSLFVVLAVFLGDTVLKVAQLIPVSMLGILLFYAGAELALSILDLETREELFVCLVIVGVTLTTNLAWGFAAGLAVLHLQRFFKILV